MRAKMGARELVELGRRDCGPGKILRRGFTRKDGSYVAPSCVEDQGKPGRTPVYARILPRPEEGKLKGWSSSQGDKKRRSALKKAVKSEGCRGVILRLNLEANFTRQTSPKTYRKAREDMNWLRNQGFCKLKTKSKK